MTVVAHPSLLRELVARCETLRRHAVSGGSPEVSRRLEDATYTLCVVTGTRQLDAALFVARQQLADAMVFGGISPEPEYDRLRPGTK